MLSKSSGLVFPFRSNHSPYEVMGGSWVNIRFPKVCAKSHRFALPGGSFRSGGLKMSNAFNLIIGKSDC
jgi:hypothetical protein